MSVPDFWKTVKTTGWLTSPDGSKCPLSLEVRYTEYQPENLIVYGLFAPGDLSVAQRIFRFESGQVEGWGTLPDGRTLRIKDPLIEVDKGVEFQFHCDEFTMGMEGPLSLTSGTFHVSVRIPPTRIVETDHPEKYSYTGTISSDRKHDEGVKWQAPLGEFLVADFYHYEWDRSFTNDVLTRVKVAEIRAEGPIESDTDPSALISAIEQAIEEPLSLLSFLARRRLLWYEIRLDFYSQGPSPIESRTYMKRRRVPRLDTEDHWPLVSGRELRDGRFEELLRQYRASPVRGWLERAMVYCLAAHHEPTLETQVSMVFLALEALTTGLAKWKGTETILGEGHLAELREMLRDATRQYCAAKKLDPELDELLPQFDGIGRRSLKRRILHMVEDARIKVEDLWPEGAKMQKEMQGLVKRRNEFIHEAKIRDPVSLHKDCRRLHVILEQVILELLGWDITKMELFGFNTRGLRSLD